MSKIIGLVAIKNEETIIYQSLKCLSFFVDSIICLDDCSTDKTLEILTNNKQELKIEFIIQNKNWFRNEPKDRNVLLQYGREFGGTHFIVLDADEILTSNFLLQDKLKNAILNLNIGDTISLNWIALWRSVSAFRNDKSIWTNNYGNFIFCDDGVSTYESDFIHTSRIPNNLTGETIKFSGFDFGLLHFQFVNWDNLILKQNWYKCLEKVRNPNKENAEINSMYKYAMDETNLKTSKSLNTWFNNYQNFDGSIYNIKDNWRQAQIHSWVLQYGKDFFVGLNIPEHILGGEND